MSLLLPRLVEAVIQLYFSLLILNKLAKNLLAQIFILNSPAEFLGGQNIFTQKFEKFDDLFEVFFMDRDNLFFGNKVFVLFEELSYVIDDANLDDFIVIDFSFG